MQGYILLFKTLESLEYTSEMCLPINAKEPSHDARHHGWALCYLSGVLHTIIYSLDQR
ncbi:hypothetical protein GCM10011538_06120 [Ligilactobacillus murinus]